MSDITENAGNLPAFIDYRSIGPRYQRLIAQFESGRHVHAYLFAGPQGIGKKTLARHLASVLFCENGPVPCGECAQCRQIRDGKHSSLTEIVPENGKTIPIDRIRELISLSSMHTLDGRERIVIIEPMESLTPQAQNCLLKSLEDPDTNVIYFLLAHDASSLLDTILSRCSVFKFTPWPNELLVTHLLSRGASQTQAQRVAALSGGNVGEALSLLEDQTSSDRESALTQLLSVSSAKDAVRCSSTLKDMAGNADQVLFLLERHLQQLLLAKSGVIPAELLDPSPLTSAMKHASVQDLVELIDRVLQARKMKMSNVNWQSNIDHLIFNLLEAAHTWQRS